MSIINCLLALSFLPLLLMFVTTSIIILITVGTLLTALGQSVLGSLKDGID